MAELAAGVHLDVPESVYHADPAPQPSLSASVGRILIEQSPLHAWTAHPRLNPGYAGGDVSEAADNGSILHKLILGRGADVVMVEADDWRTKAAREARDEARGAGKLPVLAETYVALANAAARILGQIAAHPDCVGFADGKPEATLIWQEANGIWCRARVDMLPGAPNSPLYDLKTTKLSASPRSWDRRVWSTYCFQAAFYLRGARALGYSPQEFLFIVAEQESPHAIATFALAPSLMAYAERRVERAIGWWAHALKHDEWPGYVPRTAYVEAPAWREVEEEMMEDAT